MASHVVVVNVPHFAIGKKVYQPGQTVVVTGEQYSTLMAARRFQDGSLTYVQEVPDPGSGTPGDGGTGGVSLAEVLQAVNASLEPPVNLNVLVQNALT